MEAWKALLLGVVQGLTEFLPVSSSGHLMIAREVLGVDAEGFLDFTVAVHCATVLSTIAVFWATIWRLVKGVFRRGWNDEKDYAGKLLVSMVPVAVVGVFFKDAVEGLFGESLALTGAGLLLTAGLLWASDRAGRRRTACGQEAAATGGTPAPAVGPRNGIGWWAALAVGVGQAVAVAPGVSRSGTTIATGLLAGVRRDVMAGFSFLMVLVPILGEQALILAKGAGGEAGAEGAEGVGAVALVLGFMGAFVAGTAACRAMVALVRRARMGWFALYCALVGAAVLWWGWR